MRVVGGPVRPDERRERHVEVCISRRRGQGDLQVDGRAGDDVVIVVIRAFGNVVRERHTRLQRDDGVVHGMRNDDVVGPGSRRDHTDDDVASIPTLLILGGRVLHASIELFDANVDGVAPEGIGGRLREVRDVAVGVHHRPIVPAVREVKVRVSRRRRDDDLNRRLDVKDFDDVVLERHGLSKAILLNANVEVVLLVPPVLVNRHDDLVRCFHAHVPTTVSLDGEVHGIRVAAAGGRVAAQDKILCVDDHGIVVLGVDGRVLEPAGREHVGVSGEGRHHELDGAGALGERDVVVVRVRAVHRCVLRGAGLQQEGGSDINEDAIVRVRPADHGAPDVARGVTAVLNVAFVVGVQVHRVRPVAAVDGRVVIVILVRHAPVQPAVEIGVSRADHQLDGPHRRLRRGRSVVGQVVGVLGLLPPCDVPRLGLAVLESGDRVLVSRHRDAVLRLPERKHADEVRAVHARVAVVPVRVDDDAFAPVARIGPVEVCAVGELNRGGGHVHVGIAATEIRDGDEDVVRVDVRAHLEAVERGLILLQVLAVRLPDLQRDLRRLLRRLRRHVRVCVRLHGDEVVHARRVRVRDADERIRAVVGELVVVEPRETKGVVATLAAGHVLHVARLHEHRHVAGARPARDGELAVTTRHGHHVVKRGPIRAHGVLRRAKEQRVHDVATRRGVCHQRERGIGCALNANGVHRQFGVPRIDDARHAADERRIVNARRVALRRIARRDRAVVRSDEVRRAAQHGEREVHVAGAELEVAEVRDLAVADGRAHGRPFHERQGALVHRVGQDVAGLREAVHGDVDVAVLADLVLRDDDLVHGEVEGIRRVVGFYHRLRDGSHACIHAHVQVRVAFERRQRDLDLLGRRLGLQDVRMELPRFHGASLRLPRGEEDRGRRIRMRGRYADQRVGVRIHPDVKHVRIPRPRAGGAGGDRQGVVARANGRHVEVPLGVARRAAVVAGGVERAGHEDVRVAVDRRHVDDEVFVGVRVIVLEVVVVPLGDAVVHRLAILELQRGAEGHGADLVLRVRALIVRPAHAADDGDLVEPALGDVVLVFGVDVDLVRALEVIRAPGRLGKGVAHAPLEPIVRLREELRVSVRRLHPDS
mmetsp:Transcript_25795/g.80778  ORF Transcript_25795/g.80778 Transcript_25795/m.80778 type:complete len:1103 (-) Transcript_25795:1167-4475(-)